MLSTAGVSGGFPPIMRHIVIFTLALLVVIANKAESQSNQTKELNQINDIALSLDYLISPNKPPEQVVILIAESRHEEKIRLAEEKKKEQAIKRQRDVIPRQTETRLEGSCSDFMRQANVSNISIALRLVQRESGCNPTIANKSSGAYGIPQALPGHKMASAGADWQTNPVTQLRWMEGYVMNRYGSWENALSFHDRNNWY
jgi:hypothetical protein